MVGLVRGRDWVHYGARYATSKLWRRAGKLYVLAVALTLGFTALAKHLGFGSNIKGGANLNDDWPSLILNAITGQYVYGWTDFLIYYAAFLFVSPLILWALHKRLWQLVLVASASVWLLRGDHFGLAWQLLFVIGIIAGYHLPRLEAKWRSLAPRLKRNAWMFLGSFMAITVALGVFFIHFHGAEQWYRDNLESYFVRQTMEPARIIVALLWFSLLYGLFSKYQAAISRLAGGFLTVLGRNSLLAYTLQGIVIFLLDILLGAWVSDNIAVNFAIVTAVLWLIWWLVIFLSQSPNRHSSLPAGRVKLK